MADNGEIAHHAISISAQDIYTPGQHQTITEQDEVTNDLHKYSLLIGAYMNFENEKVVKKGRTDPNKLYDSIVKLHNKLCT